jgi:hypothetical protein
MGQQTEYGQRLSIFIAYCCAALFYESKKPAERSRARRRMAFAVAIADEPGDGEVDPPTYRLRLAHHSAPAAVMARGALR